MTSQTNHAHTVASNSGLGYQMGQGWKLELRGIEIKRIQTWFFSFGLKMWSNCPSLMLVDPSPLIPPERVQNVSSIRCGRLPGGWCQTLGWLLLTSKTTARLIDATLTKHNHLVHVNKLNPTCLSNHEHRGIQNAIPFRHKSILRVKVLFWKIPY